MSRYRRMTGGYTILEVIIVLTISSLLFASTLAVYTRQNNRTQFTESVNTFAQNLQDVLNDVETGFYPHGNFVCTATATGPEPSAGSSQQGTNSGCTFLGKAIQFAPGPSSATNKSNFDIYTVMGLRMTATPPIEPVANIDQAKPRGLDVLGVNGLVERKSLSAGIRINSVKSADGTHTYAGLAMVSTSGSSGAISTGLNSRASLAVITGNINNSKSVFLDNIRLINSGSIAQAADGVKICLRETGTGGRSALVELAAGESQIIVNTKIDQTCT